MISSKFLSVYNFSFIPGLAAPGVGEPKSTGSYGDPALTELKVWTKRWMWMWILHSGKETCVVQGSVPEAQNGGSSLAEETRAAPWRMQD